MHKVIMLGLAIIMTPTSAMAQDGPQPGTVIPEYGRLFATPDAQERPDPKLAYRVVFSITKAAPAADKVNPSLDKVARFLNLLGANGVRAKPGDIVAIVHGPATPIVTKAGVYARKTGTTGNPNLDLIAKLRAAGVIVAVCDQALHGSGFTSSDVAPDVRVDVSAMTTMTTLQLRGWALMPD